MSPLSVRRPSRTGRNRRGAQPLDASSVNRVAPSAGAPAPRATLPGPSRRITVEPLTVPRPAPYITTPAPIEVEPREEPRPVRDPIPTP